MIIIILAKSWQTSKTEYGREIKKYAHQIKI